MTGARKISIAEARRLQLLPGNLICWRPEPTLPETQQYCLLLAD